MEMINPYLVWTGLAGFILILLAGGLHLIRKQVPVPAEKSRKQALSPEEVQHLLFEKQDLDFQIIDIRNETSFKEGHLPKAHHLDFLSATFEEQLSFLDREKAYLIYSDRQSSVRKTLRRMKTLGFEAIFSLKGGFKEWQKSNYPLD